MSNHRVHFRLTRRNGYQLNVEEAIADLKLFITQEREIGDVFQEYQRQNIDVDVHIIAGNKWNQKLFKVHKLILKERSDYFKVALSDQWVQKDPNGIIIFRKENISPEIFDLLLEYIYTGKVSVPLCDTNVDFVDLIGAADEILLPQLVTSLEGYLVDMYLSESTKLLEVETWLQSNIVRLVSLKKDIPEGLSLIRSRFEEHVRTTGHDSIQEITNACSVEPTIYVNALLKVFNKYHHMVQTIFENEAGFVASFNKFCDEFINHNVLCTDPFLSSPSQLLVVFCDIFLRRNEKSSMVDNKDVINNIIKIFKYLRDKDFFEKFYSQLLAERLLTQSSFSEEAELNMISRLENECGLEYTSKMRLLFHNIGLSKDLNNQFKEHLNIDDAEQVDFYILDMEALPMPPVVSKLIIPDEIEKTFQRFKKFYKDKYPSRRPNLLHHLSKGELKANYLKTPKVFQASTYQMSILLRYNKNTSYTCKELLQNTGINQDLLDQQLEYLTNLKLLHRNFVSDPDKITYDLNFEFDSEEFQITLKDPEEEMQFHFELQRRLKREREFQIESAVFQTIRYNRGIGRNLLMCEVIDRLQHKFIPAISAIKRAIDSLIKREYIKYVDNGYRKIQ